MRAFLLLLLSGFLFTAVTAQTVSIPDANFKTALLNHIPVINTNGDGEIQVSEAEAFTGTLQLNHKSIADYTGLEAFRNIQQLNSIGNMATTIVLTNKPNLDRVALSNGQLTSLTVQGLPLLAELYAENNRLTSLSVSNLPMLQNIVLGDNRLTTLTIENFPKLWSLDCARNLLTSITVSNLPLLRFLTCQQNQLINPSFSNFPFLERLNMESNPFASLSLNNLPFLEELSCGNSNITSFTQPLLPSLKVLSCSNAKITSVSLSGYMHLQRVYLDNNKISSLSLRNLPVLNELDFKKNKLTTLSLDSLPQLTVLTVGRDSLRSISLRIPSLLSFHCDSSMLTELDLSQTRAVLVYMDNNPYLQYINLKNGHIDYAGSSYTYLITNAPALVQVCGDEGELARISTALNTYLPGQVVAVSSLCNFVASAYNIIKGELRFDATNNGCTAADSAISNIKIKFASPTETGYAFTNNAGRYAVNVTGSPDTVSVVPTSNFYSAAPASQIFSFAGTGSTVTANFCITSNGVHPDADITILPLNQARPGFIATYKLVYRNKGNQLLSGTITLTFDNTRVAYNNSAPAGTASTSTITWNYAGLSPFETRTITVQMIVATPPTNNSGDILSYNAVINPVTGDETPLDNSFSLKQIVVNSMDPNDKQVLEGDKLDIGKLDNYLHYIVRFQNTGTADAINVVIKDSLSAKLDWNTFTPIAASHSFNTLQNKGDHISFTFNNINLPGASVNEPASHGFVSFKIKPKSDLIPGDIITNKADIYFDFNAAIVTNTVTTTITKPTVASGTEVLVVYSNPSRDFVAFTTKPEALVQSVALYSVSGQRMPLLITESAANYRKINVSSLPEGIYLLEVITTTGKTVKKIMVLK